MSELIKKIDQLFEQIADGSASTQRSSTMPTSMAGLKTEGGKAFRTPEGVLMASPIKREYVPNTLIQVYSLLEKLGFIDMSSIQPLGSTLHLSKPYLGDLDILVRPSRPLEDLLTFKTAIYNSLYLEGIPIRDLAEKGREFLYDEFSFLFPIIDDNNQTTPDKVQVDLLLSENEMMYNWRYYWYASPRSSAWKGAARNVLLGVIASRRGFSWTKEGLFKKTIKHYYTEFEESELITACPFEAVKVVFGDQADISTIESVESMRSTFDTSSVLMPLKDAILKRFNELVENYELEGREMRNPVQGTEKT